MGCGSKISFEERRKWKHKMYSHWRDTLEQRLAGVNAALEKLEEQMERDNKNPLETPLLRKYTVIHRRVTSVKKHLIIFNCL